MFEKTLLKLMQIGFWDLLEYVGAVLLVISLKVTTVLNEWVPFMGKVHVFPSCKCKIIAI